MTNEYLCNVLNSCQELELLNIVKCEKMGRVVLDRAVQVTQQRVDNLLLKLIIDRELIGKEEIISSPLLKLLIVDK